MEQLFRAYARHFDDAEWFKAVYAACLAAVIFLVLQMMIAALFWGESPLLPLRMIGAIALGTGALVETDSIMGVMLVAFLLHFGLSIMTAWILIPLIHGNPLTVMLGTGAAAGLVIYLVNFHVLTMGFTWFEGMRGMATLVNHLLFGMVLTGAYHYQTRIPSSAATARYHPPASGGGATL